LNHIIFFAASKLGFTAIYAHKKTRRQWASFEILRVTTIVANGCDSGRAGGAPDIGIYNVISRWFQRQLPAARRQFVFWTAVLNTLPHRAPEVSIAETDRINAATIAGGCALLIVPVQDAIILPLIHNRYLYICFHYLNQLRCLRQSPEWGKPDPMLNRSQILDCRFDTIRF
jgi:hypothetical protein